MTNDSSTSSATKLRNYHGVYTALVTPFSAGKVDQGALRDLIEAQLAGGVSGVVPCGTTGETPTLSDSEKEEVIALTAKTVAGRCKVIAGTGSNSTHHTIENTRRAKDMGASEALVVVPYYNKPSQVGLEQHFRAVAAEGGLPVMLYNVPGRTACDLQAETVVRLQNEPRIVAIKEAAGSTDRIAELRARCRPDFSILSGDDSLTLPMMAVGADGVVSVASNIFPKDLVQMVEAALANDFARAGVGHARLRRLFSALFVEPNPVPAKAVLAMLGKMAPDVRLPLSGASDTTKALLKEVLAELSDSRGAA